MDFNHNLKSTPQFTIKSVHDFLNEAPVCLTVSLYVCPASVLQAMAVLVCAEMYQVKRLQHLCEVCVCAYLQSMPSRELASTGISVIRLLRRAKVSVWEIFSISKSTPSPYHLGIPVELKRLIGVSNIVKILIPVWFLKIYQPGLREINRIWEVYLYPSI